MPILLEIVNITSFWGDFSSCSVTCCAWYIQRWLFCSRFTCFYILFRPNLIFAFTFCVSDNKNSVTISHTLKYCQFFYNIKINLIFCYSMCKCIALFDLNGFLFCYAKFIWSLCWMILINLFITRLYIHINIKLLVCQ